MTYTLEDLIHIAQLPKYTIRIGVFAEKASRKEKDNHGLTNATLLYIHENGGRAIPPRPVLQYAIEWANQQMPMARRKAIQAYVSSGYNLKVYELELEKFAMRVESYAKHLIRDNQGVFAPNAPSTIARKKGVNHPLFDTGQMSRMIQAKLIKL